MRTRLLLVLLAVPALCAALPGDGAAQRRDHGRVHVYREGHGYRDRIVIPSHRYKEPAVRYRDAYRDTYRYRDGYRYRDQYGYRDQHGYRNRDQYRYRDRDRYGYQYGRRRVNLVDLVLVAAGARYRDGHGHRHSSRCGHRRGIHIDL
jgi:hypothetical protein